MGSKNADAAQPAFSAMARAILLVGALLSKQVSSESFSNRGDLKAAVDQVVAGSWSGDDISLWDVSEVDNMGYVSSIDQGLFHQASSFNGDISKWNVSGVTSMRFVCLASRGELRSADASWPGLLA